MICLTYCITLPWQYPWDKYVKVEASAETKSSFVLVKHFHLESIALWANFYANSYSSIVSKVLFMKVCTCMIHFVYSLFTC